MLVRSTRELEYNNLFGMDFMIDRTPIDLAHAAMQTASEDTALRMQFYEKLVACELFLLLAEESKDDTLSPEVFDLTGSRFALVFDREERLAQFSGRTVPYAGLSGRVIVSMLGGQKIGLGVNLDVASSSILIPAEAVEWLATILGEGPQPFETQLREFFAPSGLPEILLTALDGKLAIASGLVRTAYLVGVRYQQGQSGHLLAFVDARPGTETALVQAVNEALTFSGIEAGSIDVGFFDKANPLLQSLSDCGLRFDLPDPLQAVRLEAPWMKAEKPPILR